MRLVTLDDLMSRSRELADQVNSAFISDTELTFRINQRIAQLYDMLCAADADRYVTTATLTTTSNSTPENWFVELPADFYVCRGVDLRRGRGRYPLETFALQERDLGGEANTWPVYPYSSIRYRVAGGSADEAEDRIYFNQNPGNNTYTLYYLPAAPVLVDGEDTFNGFNGWEDWVIFKAAIDMMNKEESDSSALQAECMQIEQRIKLLGTMRDMGSAPQVADVRSGYSYRGRRVR
jgi:hypothetical protein